MSTKDPDQLKREVDATRRTLSDDVNDLRSSGRPGEVAKHQVARAADSAGDALTRWKDRLMGTLARDDTADPGSPRSGDDPGNPITQRTQGAPLATGVIAAAAGWVLGALIPASERESQAADAIADRAAGPVQEEIRATLEESADHLKQPAQEAVESVRSTATEAAESVRDEATAASQHVKDSAQRSAETVRDADDHGTATREPRP